MELRRDQKFTLSPEVMFQEVGGEMVLLDLASEQYFGLDQVGARIWQLLTEGVTVGELLDTLFKEYEVDRETLESDVGELLTELSREGLFTAAGE